jgi:predicted GNAT family acetyltransferase
VSSALPLLARCLAQKPHITDKLVRTEEAIMYRQCSTAKAPAAPRQLPTIEPAAAWPLTTDNEKEVFEFLGERPLHTVAMAGFIRDNSIDSPLNRGTFYGCRDSEGKLEGVALIGHATLFETRTDGALQAFAKVAKNCTTTHLVMGEEQRIDEFWTHYSDGGQRLRREGQAVLLELQWPIDVREEVVELRRAIPADLDLILPVHALMALGESGVDPREKDFAGFHKRCLRRIEKGRTLVCFQAGQLMFKAEIAFETPAAIYLEGVWVNPEKRHQGYGLRCMSQLARTLLPRTQSLCLFVNDQNKEARQFYQHAGYKPRGIYDTIFLK